MIVIALTNCPVGLRGDLSKWLLEIQVGVFVGNVSARVRENLWKRIVEGCGSGRATMVFSAPGEQKLDFRTVGDAWEPIDFDGLKLMLRPSPSRLVAQPSTLQQGFSKAAVRRLTKRMKQGQMTFPKSYVVIDLETTGTNEAQDEIIEMAALRIEEGDIVGRYVALVRSKAAVPAKIEALTGISADMLDREGLVLSEALSGFLTFVGDGAVVSHNARFDFVFLRQACAQCDLPLFSNRCIDTLALAKQLVEDAKSHCLADLLSHFGLDTEQPHRAENDCIMVWRLYEKLIKLLNGEDLQDKSDV